MVGTLKAARAAAMNDAYISPFQELDLANATHSASTAPLVFSANDNRDGEAAVASWSLSCGCGCGKGWTSFFRDGVGDRLRVPGVDNVTLLDTIGDSPETARPITVNSTTYAVIEDFNDQDFFSVTLVAGQSYAISQLLHIGGTATGDGTLLSGVPLADAYLELYGPDGVTLLAEADGGSNTTPSGLDAKLYFTPTETGTYYINARSYDADPTNGTRGDFVGDYTLNVRAVDATEVPLPRFYSEAGQAPNALLDSLDWGSTWDHTVRNPDGDSGTRSDNGVADGGTPITNTEYGIVGKNVMKFYFAKLGDVFLSEDPLNPGLENALQARNMHQWEKDAFLATMDIYEQVTDLKYIEVDNRADADIKIIIYQGTPGVGASLLGRMSPPGEQNEGQTEINGGDYRWTEEGVSPGGFFFPTLLHEWGHGHGMKHPHDNGGGGPIMRGAGPSEDPVEGAIGGAYGDFGLSQQIYTIMSYNDGWNETDGVGGRPAGHGGPSSGGLEMQADHFGWMGTLGALDIALLQDKYGVNEDWATGDDVYIIEDTNEAGHYYRTIWDGGGNDEIRYVGARDAVIDLRAATLQYEEGGGGRVSFAMGAWTGFTIANGVVIERATGGDGDDILTGNTSGNTLDGGAGDDILDGGRGGMDHLIGGAGIDQVTYAGHDTGVEIYLDSQVSWDGVTMDFLSSIENAVGTDHADYIVGDAGANRLEGGAGDDVLEGGAGDDILIGGLGVDHLRGGDGIDQITYAGHDAGVQIYLDSQVSWDGVTMDFLSSIENAIGTDHADYMVGDAGANRLEGGDGDDVLNGGAGDDILIGGGGVDHLRGGEGIDQITYSGHATGVQIYLDSQVTWDGVSMDFLSSIENAVGSDHADYIVGAEGRNVLSGGAGDDQISGMGGDDVIDGGAGDDVFMLRGLAADYTITAEGGGYRVTDAVGGRDGSDLLTGIETLRFGDGSTFALASSAPEVLPALGGGKSVAAGPEVFPGAPDDRPKDSEPEVLPGIDDDSPTLVVDWPTTGFGPRNGDTAETLSPFGDLPSDGDYLLPAGDDGYLPEVLPALDDGFILAGKFDDLPPVMPTAPDMFDTEGPSITGMDLARELLSTLAGENPFNAFGESLTLPGGGHGPAPFKDTVWE